MLRQLNECRCQGAPRIEQDIEVIAGSGSKLRLRHDGKVSEPITAVLCLYCGTIMSLKADVSLFVEDTEG